MVGTLVVLTLIVVRLGEAKKPCSTSPPPAPAPPPGGGGGVSSGGDSGPSTTGAGCNTPACKGILGAAAGAAGLAAIGGLIALGAAGLGTTNNPTLSTIHPTWLPTQVTTKFVAPPTTTQLLATTTQFVAPPDTTQFLAIPTTSIKGRGGSSDSSSGSSWLPFLLGLLALLCCFAILGAFFIQRHGKKATPKRSAKSFPAVAPEAVSETAPLMAPEPPLMGHYEQPTSLAPGHYEQPMSLVPVNAAPSFSNPYPANVTQKVEYVPVTTQKTEYVPVTTTTTTAPLLNRTTAVPLNMTTAAPSYMPMAPSTNII